MISSESATCFFRAHIDVRYSTFKIMTIVIDLPTELLFEITSYLDQNDYTSLVLLAFTCRHFYNIFMSRIHEEQIQHFSRLLETPRLRIAKRIEMPMKDTSEDFSLRSFIGDPFSESIGRLHFAVGGGEKELQSVLGVISRAKYLQSVHLELGYSCSQRRVARAFNTCMAKPHLSLTVQGRIADLRRGPFKYEIVTPKSKLLGLSFAGTKNTFFKSFLAAVTRPFLKATRQLPHVPDTEKEAEDTPLEPAFSKPSLSSVLVAPEFRFKRPPYPQLSSFSIQTNALFLPSLYPMTLNVLNNSSVHTLSISDTPLTLYDWSRILPSITMPALKSLSIGDVSIAFPDLLAFFERHRSIENLDFTHNDVIGVVKFNFPPKRKLLPRLTSLTAHSDYIVPFMQHKKAGYFRDLQNISINGPDYDLDVPFNLLSEDGFKGLSITLDELSSATLVEWILSGNLKRGRKQPHGLLGVASLAMHVHRDFGAYLAEWSRKELLNWQIENMPVMEEFKQRGSQSEMYLQIAEHLVRSVCPHMKEFMYHFV